MLGRLWDAGIQTLFSCQGGPTARLGLSGSGYLTIVGFEQLRRFIEAALSACPFPEPEPGFRWHVRWSPTLIPLPGQSVPEGEHAFSCYWPPNHTPAVVESVCANLDHPNLTPEREQLAQALLEQARRAITGEWLGGERLAASAA
jgi:hypothetical protein